MHFSNKIFTPNSLRWGGLEIGGNCCLPWRVLFLSCGKCNFLEAVRIYIYLSITTLSSNRVSASQTRYSSWTITISCLKTREQEGLNPVGFNPLNAELNPIRHLLALVGARHIVHVSRIRVNWLGHGIVSLHWANWKGWME